MRAFLCFAMALALLLTLGLARGTLAQNASVWIAPPSQSIPVNQSVAVEIKVQGVTNLCGLDIRLTFDPTRLEAVDADGNTANGVQISPGDFLNPAQGRVVLNLADNATGQVQYVFVLLGSATPGRGAGVLARITFRAKAQGNAAIVLNEVSLADCWAEPVPSTLMNGSITVLQLATPSATPTHTATRRPTSMATPTRTYTPTPTLTRLYCPEPQNDTRAGACGPLMPNAVYTEYIFSASDEFDWFYFDMAVEHSIEVWLTSIPQGCDYDLYLASAEGNLLRDSANGPGADEHILWAPGPGGRYYLVVTSIDGTWSANDSYELRVDFGQAAPTRTPTRSPTPTATRSGLPRSFLPIMLR